VIDDEKKKMLEKNHKLKVLRQKKSGISREREPNSVCRFAKESNISSEKGGDHEKKKKTNMRT